ncbi:MAG TPA: circularly permuted type 2 ATP-grasp protein, partial [Gammaproteobacteria bacterium]|nr:circularly permuted type 2 ATP-grasp protein [Gammaproteobacteria bacterium]
RVVTSRCLPEIFASQNVRRHANFFRAFNDHFLSLAGKDEPIAVFLSRGPSKLTYFDHAYLARYLGHNIVEGSDLTVRDDRVYLKTIEGLRQVDLIVRTVRSDMTDPLELRPDSMIGVPGLLQAARAGTVTIGNRLGSGLVESAAFLSFLPSLSRFLLGEELAIPSVATWWCGQEHERRYVLEHLDELLVRRISTTRSVLVGGQDGRVSKYLTTVARDRLIDMIEHAGHDFVGQEPLALSTTPVWSNHTLRPEPSVMRIYVAATANGYEVLPGGLTRISHESDPHAAWLAASDISKDTWVLSDEPVEPFSLLAQRQDGGRLRRGHRNLPSRAADHLFWLGRYTERAEAAVRLFRSLVIRLAGEIGVNRHLVSHERLVSLLVMHKHMSARRGKRAMQQGREAVEHELWAILFDPECRDGLANVLRNVRRTAEVVRERLSFDAYRILTDMTDLSRNRATAGIRESEQALRLLNRLVQYLAAFSGMAMENMTRGYGWRFLDMGRRIERIRAINHLVQHLTVHDDPETDGGLELLLELADSTMTYRGRYHTAPRIARVLDLVLADESNPRSIAFQAARLNEHLAVLPHTEDEGLLTDDQRITTQISNDLRLADVHKLGATKNRFGARTQIDRLTRELEQSVDALSDHISQQYFSHSLGRQVSGARHAG